MRHFDEELLILFAVDPNSCSDQSEIASHLVTCPQCNSLLTSIRQDLRDEQPAVLAPLTGVLDLEDLLRKEEDLGNRALQESLFKHCKDISGLSNTFRTLGGLRALLKQLPAIRRTLPQEALKFSEYALRVSEMLDARVYPQKAIAQVRGVLWKEHAASLRVLGRFQEALSALDHAEDQLAGAATDFELAGVWYGRAATLREIDELDIASLWLAEAMDVYRRFGDIWMQHRAEYLHAAILYRQGNYSEARSGFRDLLPRVERDGDTQTVAMTLNGLAQCAVDLQEYSDAEILLHQALAAYQTCGLPIDSLRARWGLARLHVSLGRFAEGIAALRQVQSEYRRFEIPEETNLVGLDLADALLAVERHDDAARVCEEVLAGLRESGSTPNILRAVEYLREATQRQQASRALISQVRSFVEKSSRSPERQFQPLP
jgi:tetratricopeptide (TPR) repeat protein